MKQKLLILFAILGFSTQCSLFQKEKEDNTTRNLLIALALQNASASSAGLLNCSNSFSGIACIPDSLSSSSTASTKALGRTTTTDDTKYTDLPKIYSPVRDTLALNKQIMNNIGTLIANLRSVSVSDTPLTGSTTSDGKKVKYKYSKSTKRTDGKHLEIWWDAEAAPYNSLKSLEIDFVDGGDTGTVEGQVWVRGLNSNNTSLYKAYVAFNMNGSTKVRTSSVVIDGYYDATRATTERMHFYVSEASGVAKVDGGFTVTSLPLTIGTDTYASSNRAYLYTAAGSSTRAAVKIALPLVTNGNSDVFDNGNVANIAEIWTDWLLFHLKNRAAGDLLPTINLVCSTITAPATAHPTTNEGSDSNALKACFDKLIAAGNSGMNSFYYIAAARNPVYYSHSGTSGATAVLQAIEDAPDVSYDTVKNALRTAVRSTSDSDYKANFTASGINSINLATGAGLTVNEQWGDGATGVNSTNGSADNTAGF